MTRTEAYLRFALLATTVLSALPASAGELLPSGPSVAQGKVGISTPAAGAMTIRQSSPNAIVNWRGFSIGQGARVDIEQPGASAAILNRVTGSTPSTIAGQLNANGQVYLLNPNGILIQKSGTVRTGAFVASTLAMTDADFAAGKRNLFGNGRSAAVVNEGSIEVGPGGYAALVGGRVENAGTITARMGRIGLGAGEKATLDVSGDGFLQVGVPSEQAPGDDGALISNSGRLVADGGRVELRAATARQMARQVINLSGIVQARTVSGVSGAITLGGGEGGRVRVTGKLDASAPRPAAEELATVATPPPRPDRGGSIVVSGAAIELVGATLDASGAGGGGTILVGGDYRGGGALPRADTTSVDAASLISADTLDAGDGGSVIVWSDEQTTYEGTIRARGGPNGGDGGFAEVSGKDRLWFAGAVDLSAPSGTVGTLLVDPTDISIVDDPDPESNDIAASTVETILGDVNFTLTTASEDAEAGNITVEAPLAWAGINTLTLDADNDILINAAIAAPDGGLTLTADGGAIGINAPISIAALTSSAASTTTVNAPIAVSAGGSLSTTGTEVFLSAPVTGGDASNLSLTATEGSLDVRGDISIGDNATLSLNSATGMVLGAGIAWGTGSLLDVFADGDIAISGALTGPAGAMEIGAGDTITPQGPVDVGTFTLTVGNWIQLGTPLPAFSAADFRSDDGEGGDSNFLRALGGDGTAAAPYLIADIYGLQGIGSSSVIDAALPDLSDSYALANDIDATGTVGWNDVEGAEGFDPIGVSLDAPFTGSLDGRGFDIDGLFIDRPSEPSVGLFANLSGGIQNLGLTDVDVSGGEQTGGLAALNEGVITQVSVTGTVVGDSQTEGEVNAYAGGLTGVNAGMISRASSTATVTLNGLSGNLIFAGGLAGNSSGSITDAFAAGDVTSNGVGDGGGTTGAGGLVGQVAAGGTLTRVSASGDLAANGVGPFPIVGGLVGDNAGTILQAYATGAVTKTDPVGPGFIGGLVGQHSGSINQAYATGLVAGGAAIVNGGLVGLSVGGAVAGSYWDVETTGQDESAGGTGLATAAFQDTDGFIALAGAEGWNFETFWAPPSPGFYPALYALTPVVRVDVEDAARRYGEPNPLFTSSSFGGPGAFVFGPPGDSLTIPPTTSATLASAVGPYPIATGVSATSAAGEIYRLVATDGTLTVTPRPLTITADDQRKTYGDSFAFTGTEFSTLPGQLVNGDQVTSVALASLGAPRTAPVAEIPYTISVGDAKGAGLGNYTIAFESGQLAVTPKQLIVSADNNIKIFGDELVFAGTEFTTEGLVNGDRVTRVRLDSAGAPASASVEGSPYPIIASDAQVTSNGALNYAISYEPGSLVVAERPVEEFNAGLRLSFATDLANPSDVIEISATEGFEGASGGPTLGTGENAVAEAQDTLAFVERLSSDLETRVESCAPSLREIDPFLGCVRDALADYARELDTRILELPEPLRAVSAVIQQSARQIEGVRADAARRIAAATSDEEIRAIEREAAARAGAAVRTAVVEIRKAIELIRAEDDPQLASLQAEQGAVITTALQNVEDELAQAVGL